MFNLLKKWIILVFFGVIFFSFITTKAFAIPIISVSPNNQTVTEGDTFTVDIGISGVDAFMPLNAFEFDLDFDTSVLSPVFVGDGGFIPFPNFTVESDITGTDINFALVGLGTLGIGSGVLATITFEAIAVGVSALDLNDVFLSGFGGMPILPAAINDGSISVNSATNGGSGGPIPPVPEPATIFLLGSGFVGLIFVKKKETYT